jgi:hypothetical protein
VKRRVSWRQAKAQIWAVAPKEKKRRLIVEEAKAHPGLYRPVERERN